MATLGGTILRDGVETLRSGKPSRALYDSPMPARPERTLHAAWVAGTRAMVADAVWLGGRWLLGATFAGLLAVAAMKVAGLLMPWGWVLGAFIGAGAAAAISQAVWRRWTLERAAAELDRALGLKDTLASAVALADTEAPFEQWTVMEAERLAPTVDIRRAIPVAFDWTWWAWPTVGLVTAAAGFLVPPINWTSTPPLRAVRPADQQAAAAQIAQAAQAAAAAAPLAENPASATPEQLRAVDEVLQELSRGRIEPQEAVARASAKIDELAARIERDALRDQELTDTIREQLAKAAAKNPARASPESGQPEGVRFSRVTESLNRGDLAGAAEAARDAARQLDQASPEERQRIADELDALADALEPREIPPGPEPGAPQPDPTPTSPAQGAEPPTGAPSASRPPPTAPEAAKKPDDAVEPTSGPSERPDPRPESVTPRSEPRSDEAPPDRDQVRDALRNAAREVREGQSRPEPPSKQRSEDQGQNHAPGQSQDQQQSEPSRSTRPQPSPDQQPGEPEAQRDPGSSQQPDQRRTGNAPETSPRKDDTQQGPGPTGRTDGAPAPTSEGGSKRPTAAPTGAAGPTGQQAPTGQPTPQERQGGQPAPRTDSLTQGHPAGSPEPQGQSSPNGAPPAGSDPKGMDRVAKEFERIAREQRKVDSEQKQAREMRELARRMLENSTPEQREQFRQMAERMSKREGAGGSEAGEGPNTVPQEGRTPTATAPSVPVDVRRGPRESEGPRPAERTIAEWYSSKPEARGEQTSGPIPQEALRSAAEGVQRSIEQQQVPARYEELVRRVFKRYSGQ